MTDDAREQRRRRLDDVGETLGLLAGFYQRHPSMATIEALHNAPASLVHTAMETVAARTNAEAAERLGLNPATVAYRFQELQALTGLDTAELWTAIAYALDRNIAIVPVHAFRTIRDVPTVVYRHYDLHGRLLYVGISAKHKLKQRAHNHSSASRWWRDVASSSYKEFPTRDAALAAETEAIRAEAPIYNIAGRAA